MSLRDRATLFAATVFELLTAVARTGIISTHFGPGSDRLGFFDCFGGFTDNVTALGSLCSRRLGRSGIGSSGRAPEGTGGLVTGALRDAAQEVLKSHQTRSAAKNVVANLGLNVDH